MSKHHEIADRLAERAKTEIAAHAKRARERINRSIGQVTRYTLARIELARRAAK